MTGRVREFSNGPCVFEVVDGGPLDGEVVVLLHGFPQTAKAWDGVSERLQQRGYRTLTFDQRGYAPRARPRGRTPYRMGALVSDVVALVKAAGGGPVHVVGHDWGAAVAWAMAARFPALVRTLTAVSVPHPRAFLRSFLSSNQALRSYYMLFFQLPWLPELFFRYLRKAVRRSLRVNGMSRDEAHRVHTDIVETGALTGGLAWYRAIPFAGPAYAAKVPVPTTYVWSMGEFALSRRAAELCERYVTGPYRFEIIEGTHWLPEQQPDRLSEIVAERIRAA